MAQGRIIFPVTDSQGNRSEGVANVTVQEDEPAPGTTRILDHSLLVKDSTDELGPGSLLRIAGADEEAFVGGHFHEDDPPLETDRGIFVHHGGHLRWSGTPKEPWGWAMSGLRSGDPELELDRDPSGWQVGDEIAVSPTAKEDFDGFEIRKVAGINDRVVTLDAPLDQAHPSVAIPGDSHTGLASQTMTPEVLNLTRDIRVEGEPGHRSHVILQCHGDQDFSQVVDYVAFRNMGPQRSFTRPSGEPGKQIVPGRWAFHLHMNDDLLRGHRFAGLVARDIGSWAFVAHRTHGITWDRAIAYNAEDTPMRWDVTDDDDTLTPADTTSLDVHYLGCVAALVRTVLNGTGYRQGGFEVQRGSGSFVGCVAVGNVAQERISNISQVNILASGYNWKAGQFGDWAFDDNLSHNNRGAGIFGWQNDPGLPLPIRRFVSYHDDVGVMWGAYNNRQAFEDVAVFEPFWAQLALSALSGGGPRENADIPLHVDRFTGRGGQFGIYTQDNKPGQTCPVLIENGASRGWSDRGFWMNSENPKNPASYHMRNYILEGPRERWFLVSSNATPHAEIRCEGVNGESFTLYQRDDPRGVFDPAWNAKVER